MVILLASCANTPVQTVHVNEKPGEGAFSLVRTKIELPIVDFEGAVFHDELGYPHVDFKKFDRKNPGKVIKPFEAVVFENKYARLTLIPGMGKPYSFIYKVTGHEEFFIPTVAQVLTSPNNLKWWFALGGVEYTMPDNEHGETWAATWEWEIAEDSSAKKTVRMKVKELRHGLLETIDISMYPDKAFYEAVISIKNSTKKPVEFQHWINPMWVPGGRGEITPHTEFVIPTRQVYIDKRRFNDWMLDYHPEKSRTQSFDGPLRFLMGWKGVGDLLACKLEHGYYSAFSHDEDEGIVRVFPKDKCPGCNIWAWGINPKPDTRKLFSGSEKCRGYVEMWGGITHGFAEYYRLEPGASISWTEWMYPYHLTKGLHYANEDFAATFTRLAGGKHVLRLCPAGDLTGVECKAVTAGSNRTCLHVVYDSIYPKKKLPQFTCPETKEKLELIILKGGKEIIRLSAKGLPEFPHPSPFVQENSNTFPVRY